MKWKKAWNVLGDHELDNDAQMAELKRLKQEKLRALAHIQAKNALDSTTRDIRRTQSHGVSHAAAPDNGVAASTSCSQPSGAGPPRIFPRAASAVTAATKAQAKVQAARARRPPD